MTQYRNPQTGHIVTPYDGLIVAGQVLHSRISAESMAELGYLPYAAPPPAPETLEAARERRVGENRAECSSRILAVWSENRQRSAALGVYTPEETAACTEWIRAHIAAENAAADLIEAAQDTAAVEAVKVVWP